jgi:drug/metabolite transporter (DMT)-like permease
VPWAWWLSRRTADRGAFLGLSPLNLKLSAIVGLLAGWGYALFAYTGFTYAPAAHASVLIPGSLPLWTAIVAVWWLRERLTPARAVGLALILAGDLFVGGRSLLQTAAGGTMWRGDLLFICASWCWAVYTVVVRRYSLDAIKTTVAIAVFTFITYVPAYAALVLLGVAPSRLLEAPVSETLFQMAYQGLGPVVIAGISFTSMVKRFGPVRTTMITSLVPGLSALLAVYLLGEPLHWYLIAGLALVTAGMVLGVRRTELSQGGLIFSPPKES